MVGGWMLNGKLFGEAHLLNISTIISNRNDVDRQSFFELVWNSLTFPRAKTFKKKSIYKQISSMFTTLYGLQLPSI